jgi:hypothetical protein
MHPWMSQHNMQPVGVVTSEASLLNSHVDGLTLVAWCAAVLQPGTTLGTLGRC